MFVVHPKSPWSWFQRLRVRIRDEPKIKISNRIEKIRKTSDRSVDTVDSALLHSIKIEQFLSIRYDLNRIMRERIVSIELISSSKPSRGIPDQQSRCVLFLTFGINNLTENFYIAIQRNNASINYPRYVRREEANLLQSLT